MKLPTAEERQAIRDETARKNREYAEQKQREADAIVEAALRIREQRIVEVMESIETAIHRAVACDKDHAYVRIAEGREWSDDNALIANEVCRRAKLEAPEYVFALAIEEWSYKDQRCNGEGYPTGDEFWVTKHWQAIKVTWPTPEDQK